MKNSIYSVQDPRNLSILTDFYELTMANGFFESGRKDDIGVFDLELIGAVQQGGVVDLILMGSPMSGIGDAVDFLQLVQVEIQDAVPAFVGFLQAQDIRRIG